MRPIHFLLALVGALAVAACQPSGGGVTADDMTLGNAKAPVTVIEYASVACPHCAKFNDDVFPAFKAKYIDTGQVFYVAREALVADPAIAEAGFLTARCAGRDKYFQVVDAIYHAQVAMETGDAHAVLLNIARSAGLTDAQFEACVRDRKAGAAIESRWKGYVENQKVNATPTFVINGQVYDKGEMTLAQLDAAIAAARTGKGQASS